MVDGGWEATVVAGTVLAFLLGGFVKGVTAMGLPLVAVPVLALFVDVTTAVPLMALPTVISNVWQVHNAGTALPALRRFWPLLLAVAAGAWLGASLIAHADKRLLSGMLGAIIVLFVAISFSGFRPRVPNGGERWLNWAVGLCAGLSGGLTSIFGPPLAMYLLSLRIEREEFVGAMGVIMLAGAGALAVALSRYGLLGGGELAWSIFALAPSFAGLYAGAWLRRRIRPEVFQRVVLVALFVIGVGHLRALF